MVVAGEVGGAERMLCDLASRPDLSGADHAVALMTPSEALARALLRAGLRVHDRGRVRESPLSFLWRSLGPQDVAWLARVFDEERADLVHLHTFASQVLGTRAARRRGLPVLRTEHSTRVYDDPTCWPFSRWSLARVDGVAYVSEHVRRVAEAKAGALPANTRVVHNGVDVARFALAPAPPGGAPFTFVAVSRLDPRKGLDLALRALASVPDARLAIVGGGGERARLEALARELGVAARVHFHGPLDDPRPAIAAAHAAICSSRTEGLGLANLEAMAMGRPVVGFAVGGVPEIVTEVTGWLAPSGDVSALAARMREAAEARDATRARGHAAREDVVARFSLEAMGRAYGAFYEALRRRVQPAEIPR